MDKSANIASAPLFNGTSGCAEANIDDWYALYSQTRNAYLGGISDMLSDDELTTNVRYQNSEDRVSLGLIFANYHRIKDPSTATEGWFTFNNKQLHDVPGRIENPYEQKVLVATAPLKTNNGDGEVTFIIPSGLVYSNKGSFSLQADWGNGSGYQNISLNSGYNVNYTSIGIKNIIIKLTQAGVDYYAKTTFTVDQVFSFSNTLGKNCVGICYDALWSDVNNTTAEAYIIYANGRSYLQKPVVFIEGQDVLDEYNFKDLFKALSDNRPEDPDVPINQLITNGYDVIILNFKRTGEKSMRNNAEVLRRLIKWINQNKTGNNKLVVGGISMGGVIARYTLAKMENVYCENHNVEKYFSLDAPHTGANIPLGLQILTQQVDAHSYSLLADIRRQARSIDAVSTKELLSLHEANNGNPHAEHTSFYNELKTLGMPQQCRNVAFSNGNTFNNSNSLGNESYNEGTEFLTYQKLASPGGDRTSAVIKINANAVSTSSNQRVLYLYLGFRMDYDYSWYVNLILGIDDIHADMFVANDNYTYQADKPYDSSPGSYLNTQEEIVTGMGGTTNGHNHHCIVPSTSAYGIETTNLMYGQNYQNIESSRLSPFDEVYASSNSVNYSHLIFPPSAGNQLALEISLSNPHENSFLNLTNETYNMSMYSYVKRLPNTNINNAAVLQINCNNGSNYGTGNIPAQGSTFVTSTFDCSSTININAGGTLKIGDGSRYGIVEITVGQSLVIHENGLLDIRYGSKLVLAGGSLVFEKDAMINLQDLESVIEIKDGGKIVIGPDAKFKWTGTGYIKINTSPSQKGVVNILTQSSGNGARFEQSGSIVSGGYNQKLIEVIGGSLSVDESITEFRLIGGKVLMGVGTIFDVASPMFLGGIKMNTPSTDKFSGIWVYGQQETSYLSSCVIENADVGLRIFTTKGNANKSTIYNSNFINCAAGVVSYGKSVNIEGGKYWGNKTGIFVSGAQSKSSIKGIEAYGNRSAIDFVGSGTGDILEVKDVNLHANSAVGAFMVNSELLPTCSRIYNNYPNSNPSMGSNILLREYSFLDIEPYGKKDGGRNDLGSDNSNSIVSYNASGLSLNKGHSNFISPNGLTFSGELIGLPITAPPYIFTANENVWNQSGLAPVLNSDYSIKFKQGTGSTLYDALILDAAPLSSISSYSCNGILDDEWEDWDSGGKPSELIGSGCSKLIDGTPIDAKVKTGLMKMYQDNPDYPNAITDFTAVLTVSYTSILTVEPPAPFEFDLCNSIIDFAYRKAKESLAKGISDGSISSETEITDPVQDILDGQNALKGYYALFDGGHEKYFQISLDQALIYRLINDRAEALEKIQALRDIAETEEENVLIDYYECIISNEIVIATSEDKLDYLAIDNCRTLLNMDAGELIVIGERPEDPIWGEVMGKRGTSGASHDNEVKAPKRGKDHSLNISSINIYPNPASNTIFVQLPLDVQVSEIRIIDMTGRLVYTFNGQSSTGILPLHVQLDNGTYFIEAANYSEVISRKKVMIVK
ncbi:MAG: T9SS type A sorting domain-containing protein [Bacteroidota bacterium]